MGETRSCQKGNWITWKTKDNWQHWIIYIKSYEGYIKISWKSENKWGKELPQSNKCRRSQIQETCAFTGLGIKNKEGKRKNT